MRRAAGACLLAVLTLGVAGCTSPAKDPDAVVEEYVALLEAGRAEAADALDTFDPEREACPELFTDAVYGQVPDRPTDLVVTGVTESEGAATVETTITLGEHHDVPVTFDLVQDSGAWRVDNTYGRWGIHVGGDADVVGEVTVQGVCPWTLETVREVPVYPGSWTFAPVDPAAVTESTGGLGKVDPVTVTATGTLTAGPSPIEPASATLWPTATREAIDAVDEEVARLLDDCVAQGYVGPSCPYNVFPASYGADLRVGSVPSASVGVDPDGAWVFLVEFPVEWQVAEGHWNEHTMIYRGGVRLAEDGTAVLTLEHTSVQAEAS